MTATHTRPTSQLSQLVAGVRTAVDARADWSETAELVADPQGRRRMSSLAEVRSRQRFPLEAMLDGVEQGYGELLEWRAGSTHPVAS